MRRCGWWLGLLAVALAPCLAEFEVAQGPFEPTMDSLRQYQCPDWFRDAKFGIWAHWGPQAVPMEGDWYAQRMYRQGDKAYQDHLARWGHPSVHGYKDIIPLWKAEKWDPERLMGLYKRAGARYFVSMGTHHDNFFLWKSKLHRWNSVEMGPRRDVVGEWQAAAVKHGLRFGVSEHLGASFTWFQQAHRSDKTGDKQGVPYDGADPKYADLYHFPAQPGDTGWYSKDPKWQQQWYNEIKELVDNYHPDLLYSDGGVAFANEVGRSMVAHLYNSNAALHGGRNEAVYNCKQLSGGRWVQDLERGVMAKIDPYPWQTDTSIGDWFYNRNWKFRPVKWVIHMLVDNVSKNGNLLLNVVQRPDGSLDPEVETMLEELATWTAIHGEAIYGSRPWQVYGEGAVALPKGRFNEDYKYNAQEIRFTTKGATLYALALGWPADGQLVIRSLAKPAGQNINNLTSLSLLGSDAKLEWTQTADALTVKVPGKAVSEWTTGLKISGTELQAVGFTPPPVVGAAIGPDAQGTVKLGADAAQLHGNVQTEQKGDHTNVGFWDNADDYITWPKVKLPAGTYEVSALVATVAAGSQVKVTIGDKPLVAKTANTGGWDKFAPLGFGQLELKEPAELSVKVGSVSAATWKAINLANLVLKPVK